MAKDDALQAEEANRLYWSHEASVGEIATRLGISRRALYELLQPQPASLPCPDCGTDTVFVNRSAQASGLARCPSCGAETALPAPRSQRPGYTPPFEAEQRSPVLASRSLALGSVALMGVVVGVVAALWFSKRD